MLYKLYTISSNVAKVLRYWGGGTGGTLTNIFAIFENELSQDFRPSRGVKKIRYTPKTMRNRPNSQSCVDSAKQKVKKVLKKYSNGVGAY